MSGLTLATLGIRVEFKDGGITASRLKDIEVAGDKVEQAATRMNRRLGLAEIEARKMNAALNEAGRSSFRLTGGMGGLSSALQAVAGALAIRQVIQLADTYTNLQSRLRLVTADSAELARAQATLYGISQSTRTGLESNVALYTSLSRATKGMGVDAGQLATITKAVAQSFQVSGANASETSAAVRQLGQAMASGVLRGDEFNSIAENAPRLQQAVAQSLGVTNGQLRAMAAEGKITSAVLANALLKSAEQINSEFGTMPVTVGGALTQIKNALLVGVGAIDSAQGSTRGLASALSDVAKLIPGIAQKVNEFFGGLKIAAAEAAVGVLKVQRTMAGLQIGFGQAIAKVPGLGGLGSSLIGQSADQLKDLDDLIRLKEKQLAVLAATVIGTNAATVANIKHGDTIKTVTALTKEQLKALEEARKRAADLKQANLLVDISDEIAKSLKKQADEAKALDAALEGVAKQYERIRNAQIARDAEAAEREAQKKYIEDMKHLWQEGVGEIAGGFVRSMAKGFEEVYSLAVKMMRRMEAAGKDSGFGYGALKLGSAAIGGGLAGYGAGQQAGSLGMGALSGAASGAMAGAAFGPWGAAIGGLVGAGTGLLGAAHAQKEAAKQMAEAQKALALNIEGVRMQIGGNSLGASIANEKARFDALRKQTEDAYATGRNEAQRNVILAQLNQLEAQRIEQLKAESALTLARLNEDVQVQVLRNNGHLEEAEALAKAIDQERRFAELRKNGITDATLAELKLSEEVRDAAIIAQQKADEAALAAAKKIEDAANAARDAAEAAQKAFDQARAVEDITIELMRAKGDENGAFGLEQQQRLDDAKKNQNDEYVARLLELQQLQRDQRAAQELIDSTGVAARVAGGGGVGASSAYSAVNASVTERTGLMIVDVLRAIETNTRTGTANGGGGFSYRPTYYFYKTITDDEFDQIEERLDQALASRTNGATLFGGTVRR